MPLVRISYPAGLDGRAIGDAVHEALMETFAVPADDRFQILTEHGPANPIVRPESYLGIAYSDQLTIMQITINDTRGVEQKKALYRAIAAKLQGAVGLRPEDVWVNLIDVKRENWSFGNGIAQYA